jgi:hypothetical protein
MHREMRFVRSTASNSPSKTAIMLPERVITCGFTRWNSGQMAFMWVSGIDCNYT